jgi:hypothetical protein
VAVSREHRRAKTDRLDTDIAVGAGGDDRIAASIPIDRLNASNDE